jgi:HSP20 family protein
MARVYIERQELPEDIRRLFDALWADGELTRQTAAEYFPPVDVIETEGGIEVLVDLPGVPSAAVQVVLARNVVLIAGHKLPPTCDHDEAAFHLAERAFGRFARAVRLDGAFDGAKATATLNDGELRVAIPQIDDRRGREIRIPVRA